MDDAATFLAEKNLRGLQRHSLQSIACTAETCAACTVSLGCTAEDVEEFCASRHQTNPASNSESVKLNMDWTD